MLALVPEDKAAADGPKLTRGGFDAGLMSSALSIANQVSRRTCLSVVSMSEHSCIGARTCGGCGGCSRCVCRSRSALCVTVSASHLDPAVS